MAEELLELGKEYPPENEAALIEQILAISKFSMKQQPHPPTLRDQHPKSHGYLQSEFIIEENIPDELKVGIFALPKTYSAWIRFSNGGSDRDKITNEFLPDTAGDVRGMAVKLMGVEGEMAADDPYHQGEQDFILINSPIFFIKDVQGYIDFFPVMGAIRKGEITFNADGSPKDVPEELREKLRAISYAFPLARKMKEKATPNLLEVPFWSSTPYRLGNHAIKFSVVPQSVEGIFTLENSQDKSHYLRESMTSYLANKDAFFDFKVQLQTDATKMKVEDSTIEWDEQLSPSIKVATIKIPQQNFNTEERQQLDEQQSFSPWHSLIEHQPLGGVNRARKIYTKLAKTRNIDNQASTQSNQ